MLLVGLTGGIGAGKSEVAQLLASHGAFVVDADDLAREVVAPGTPGLARIVAEFGRDILTADGRIDRERLAAWVFSDDRARSSLNAIIHPLVAKRMTDITNAAPRNSVVVHDIPLLAENNVAARYHLVLVVEAPRVIRMARLKDRGMSESDALARMARQATDQQRREIADVVIVNDKSLNYLARTVNDVWKRRIMPAARKAGEYRR